MPLFSRKNKSNNTQRRAEDQVGAWVNSCLRDGVPRETLYEELAARSKSAEHFELKLAYSKAGNEVLAVLAERNIEGKRLEKQGRTEDAIDLYEQNLTDRFGGLHPYDRLRIIYTKQKRFRDAIRVCMIYINLPRGEHQLTRDEDAIKRMNHHLSKLLEAEKAQKF